jgi:hypothetical protein
MFVTYLRSVHDTCCACTCRCINPSACLGNSSLSNMGAMNASGNMTVDAYKTAQCAPAYQGNVCGDCRDGYGKVRPFLCRKCMSRVTIVILYTVGALAIIGLIKLLMYFHHSSNTTGRKSLEEPISDELLKVLVLHGQWLYIISNLVNVPWPTTLALPLQILNGIWSSSNGSSIDFECIFPRNCVAQFLCQSRGCCSACLRPSPSCALYCWSRPSCTTSAPSRNRLRVVDVWHTHGTS